MADYHGQFQKQILKPENTLLIRMKQVVACRPFDRTVYIVSQEWPAMFSGRWKPAFCPLFLVKVVSTHRPDQDTDHSTDHGNTAIVPMAGIDQPGKVRPREEYN